MELDLHMAIKYTSTASANLDKTRLVSAGRGSGRLLNWRAMVLTSNRAALMHLAFNSLHAKRFKASSTARRGNISMKAIIYSSQLSISRAG